jgi:hypothetical protein
MPRRRAPVVTRASEAPRAHEAALPPRDALVLEAPILTVSEANKRGHWAKGARRAKSQRDVVKLLLVSKLGRAPAPPLEVRLVRIAPRRLDGDNLQRALKAIRDGVADWLGVDDGDPRLTWLYDQGAGAPKYYGVRVELRASARST